MDQLNNLADIRLIAGCIYCGDQESTRDHVPSRVFLDPPYPDNLPVVGACASCNNGFSSDEEYLACLIEVVVAGSTDPDRIRRPKVAAILRRSPALRARLENSKALKSGQIEFGTEPSRIENVILKLARGHAVFELSQACRHEPKSVWWKPLALLKTDEFDSFDAIEIITSLAEIGSRGIQRMMVTQIVMESSTGERSTLDLILNDWVDVQDDRYRYHASDVGDEITVKLVVGEYLACQVTWNMPSLEVE